MSIGILAHRIVDRLPPHPPPLLEPLHPHSPCFRFFLPPVFYYCPMSSTKTFLSFPAHPHSSMCSSPHVWETACSGCFVTFSMCLLALFFLAMQGSSSLQSLPHSSKAAWTLMQCALAHLVSSYFFFLVFALGLSTDP